MRKASLVVSLVSLVSGRMYHTNLLRINTVSLHSPVSTDPPSLVSSPSSHLLSSSSHRVLYRNSDLPLRRSIPQNVSLLSRLQCPIHLHRYAYTLYHLHIYTPFHIHKLTPALPVSFPPIQIHIYIHWRFTSTSSPSYSASSSSSSSYSLSIACQASPSSFKSFLFAYSSSSRYLFSSSIESSIAR